jgi:hypothetical protein
VNGPPKDSKQNIAAAVAAAKAADSVVLVMGIDGSVEAEVSLHQASSLPRDVACTPFDCCVCVFRATIARTQLFLVTSQPS